MTRRTKQQPLLRQALEGDWEVSASYAAVLALLFFVVIPLVTNPYLKGFGSALRPVGLILIGIFSLIAVIKLVAQNRSTRYTYSSNWSDADTFPRNSIPAWDKPLAKGEDASVQERPAEWSLKLIQDIEWKRFEELATAYCRELGVKAEPTSLGADGGIDIKLYEDDSGSPTSIAQCKAWNSWQVGVQQIREFLGVMTHEKIAKGFYMTSGKYTDAAKEVAEANSITLIDGETLLLLIKQLPEDSQQKLLSLALEGDYTTPSCPSCGIKMVRRTGKKGNFWGCKNYPRCHQKLNLRAS